MRASGGTDALKPQTPRPIDTVSTKRTERTALEGRMAASASFADAQAPRPEDRLWPEVDGSVMAIRSIASHGSVGTMADPTGDDACGATTCGGNEFRASRSAIESVGSGEGIAQFSQRRGQVTQSGTRGDPPARQWNAWKYVPQLQSVGPSGPNVLNSWLPDLGSNQGPAD
jgi:hypothetical protein